MLVVQGTTPGANGRMTQEEGPTNATSVTVAPDEPLHAPGDGERHVHVLKRPGKAEPPSGGAADAAVNPSTHSPCANPRQSLCARSNA